jgi:hypothetical protein
VKPDEVLVSITIPYTKEVSQKSQFVKGVSFGEILHLHIVISHYFFAPQFVFKMMPKSNCACLFIQQ